MAHHQQVSVKVNAQVDRGIAELISSLSDFPELRTLESCERDNDWAWVCFVYGTDGWRSLAKFVFDTVGPPLVSKFGDRVNLNIGITEAGDYRAEMTVNKGVISAVSKAVKRMASSPKAA